RGIRLYESDFNRSIGEWAGHWICIQMEFEELDSSEEAQSIAMHKIGAVDDFDSTKGTYAMYFRPRIEIRRNLYELSEDENKSQDELSKILGGITLNDYELVFTGRGNIDFSNDINYQRYVGNFR